MRNKVSPETFNRHKKLIGLAQKAGLMAGGIGLAALSIPFGAAVGAWTGYQAGSGQMQVSIASTAANTATSTITVGQLTTTQRFGRPSLVSEAESSWSSKPSFPTKNAIASS